MKKENAVRTTISITPSVYAKAQEVMRWRSFTKFSTLLHQLIREEWERRHPNTPPALMDRQRSKPHGGSDKTRLSQKEKT